MIKCIIFDLGGVIVDENKGITFKELAQKYNLDLKELRDVYEHYLIKYDGGKIDKGEFLNLMSKRVGKEVNEDVFFGTYFKNAVVKKDGMDFIKSLKGRYKLAILSNCSELNIQKLFKDYNLNEMFDYFFYSYKIKMLKPNPEIFIYALKKLKFKAEECLFIDDREENIIAAKEIGFKTILYKNLEQLKNEMLRY